MKANTEKCNSQAYSGKFRKKVKKINNLRQNYIKWEMREIEIWEILLSYTIQYCVKLSKFTNVLGK